MTPDLEKKERRARRALRRGSIGSLTSSISDSGTLKSSRSVKAGKDSSKRTELESDQPLSNLTRQELKHKELEKKERRARRAETRELASNQASDSLVKGTCRLKEEAATTIASLPTAYEVAEPLHTRPASQLLDTRQELKMTELEKKERRSRRSDQRSSRSLSVGSHMRSTRNLKELSSKSTHESGLVKKLEKKERRNRRADQRESTRSLSVCSQLRSTCSLKELSSKRTFQPEWPNQGQDLSTQVKSISARPEDKDQKKKTKKKKTSMNRSDRDIFHLQEPKERINELEVDNSTLKNEFKEGIFHLEDSRKQVVEGKESMTVKSAAISPEVVAVLQNQVKYHQQRELHWQMQCENILSELKTTKLHFDEEVRRMKLVRRERAKEQKELHDVEVELEHLKQDQGFDVLHQVTLDRNHLDEVAELKLQLRLANERLELFESQDSLRQTRIHSWVSDTPTFTTVKDVRIEVLTAEVNQLKANEQASTEVIIALGVELENERTKVALLSKEIFEINEKAKVDNTGLTAGVTEDDRLSATASTTGQRRTNSKILDLATEIHSSRATIENLSIQLVESKLEIERLSTLILSTEQPSPMKPTSQQTGSAEIKSELKACHARIEALTNEVLESKTEFDDLKKELIGISHVTEAADSETADSVSVKEELAFKDTNVLKEQQKFHMIMNEVDELRAQLQHCQTQVEDLELERNFNHAKVEELQQLLMIETKCEAEQALYVKSLACAELSTKLEAVSANLSRTKAQKVRLEQEREVNKAKGAELSELWVNQPAIDKLESKLARTSKLSEARQELITELEEERQRFVKKATDLSVELAALKSTIDDLSEMLMHEEDANREKDAIIKAAEIDRDEILAELKTAMLTDLDEPRTPKNSVTTPLQFISKQYKSHRCQVSFDSQGDADKAAGSQHAAPVIAGSEICRTTA